MAFPYQVNYGPSTNNPTLVPNFGTPIINNGVISLANGSQLDAAANGVNATGSITVAGTIASGNTITVTVTNGCLPGGSVAVPYTTTSSDTAVTIAAQLALLLNNNVTLSTYGWRFGTNGAGAIELYQRGPVGNFSTLSATTTGAETFTYVQMSGGTGAVVPLSNFSLSFNNVVTQFWYGKPIIMAFAALNNAVAQGVPIS